MESKYDIDDEVQARDTTHAGRITPFKVEEVRKHRKGYRYLLESPPAEYPDHQSRIIVEEKDIIER